MQALARPGAEQLLLFPDFVCTADELALDFDEEVRPVLAASPADITRAQIVGLAELDALLESMSGGDENLGHWTDEAILHGKEWESVRALARRVLVLFSWQDESPPLDRGAVYVSSNGVFPDPPPR